MKPEDFLPHRPPMLLVDEIIESSKESILCRKTFSEYEFFVQGHYPGNPIVPGVILIEAAVQAGAILISQLIDGEFQGVPVLTRVNDVRFKKMVVPGDQVELHASLTEKVGHAWFLNAKVINQGKVAARFSFACTLVESE